jgi:hypothetical protein
MFRAFTRASIIFALALSGLFLPDGARAQIADDRDPASAVDVRINGELSALGRRGVLITQARGQVLEILQTGGACARWFQETDPNVASVFRSLHYELDRGTSEIYLKKDDYGNALYKHPWGASTMEDGGRNSIITINSNGPFFVRQSRLIKVGGPAWPPEWSLVMVGPYVGDTPEVRMTILLHELGHIVGRLPVDDGSWNGESSRNTVEVLRHCKAEIHLLAKKRTNDGKDADLRLPLTTNHESREFVSLVFREKHVSD